MDRLPHSRGHAGTWIFLVWAESIETILSAALDRPLATFSHHFSGHRPATLLLRNLNLLQVNLQALCCQRCAGECPHDVRTSGFDFPKGWNCGIFDPSAFQSHGIIGSPDYPGQRTVEPRR